MIGPVLIFGAQGFLGKACVNHFRRKGHDLCAVGRRAADEITQCDMEDPAQIIKLLEATRPSVIINCAAKADFSTNVLSKIYAVNILAPAIIANYAAREKIQFIQASATLVYGARTEKVSLDNQINLDTDYGKSKLLADETILASGCKSAIVRFCGLFGRGGPEHLGLNKVIAEAANGTCPEIYGSGSARRNYLHVSDAANMIFHIADKSLSGTYLAAGSEILSIAEMFQAICDIYIPDSSPRKMQGQEAQDQIITSSPELPAARPFREGLMNDGKN